MDATAPCKYLEWDSEFFQRRIGRLTESRLTTDVMTRVNEWAARERIDCLYFLADVNEVNSIRLAEDNGFHCVDIRVTLEHRIDPGSTANNQFAENVRLVKPEDQPVLSAISRNNYLNSRFYADPNFPARRVDDMYEVWTQNSINGQAGAVLVAEFDKRPVGYITCLLLNDGSGNIGLVAVDPNYQGKSIGRALMESSLAWFRSKKVSSVSIVTQGSNIRAQRLNQKCGFYTKSMQIWFHRWFEASG
ncbi:MAG TPA: GNAT family N-acetyltransferase [Anaerolineaceae bacterium]|nr:GNAT family N-acetyltransferase [Anaerolineaceae bacterium]